MFLVYNSSLILRIDDVEPAIKNFSLARLAFELSAKKSSERLMEAVRDGCYVKGHPQGCTYFPVTGEAPYILRTRLRTEFSNHAGSSAPLQDGPGFVEQLGTSANPTAQSFAEDLGSLEGKSS